MISAAGLAITGLSGAFTVSAARAAAPSATPSFTSLRDSVPASANARTGQFTSSLMSVEVVLAPQHQAQLNGLLAAVYNPGSADYHHWLPRGQFDARFAPTVAERAAVARYLGTRGLEVGATASPFLMRATGSSRQVSAALRTSLSTYKNHHGVRYFANSSAVRMPSTMAGGVVGVIGLTNTVRAHPMIARARGTIRPSGKPAASSALSASCETGYPTRKQLFNLVNHGVSFPSGYGGGPACSGLTPSQTNSIYGAPRAGRRGKGAGVTLGLFELSAYQPSDIARYAHRFFGAAYNPPLANVIVDGGPLHPACPVGDTCPPDFNGYSGDFEVDADIETQLSVAPDVSRIIVYNAPSDETAQTVLDEYTRIAHDDEADAVSSSWGGCESDVPAVFAQAENMIFEQMALQGQSMFASSGDSGAFDCIDADGSTRVNVDDPEAQPWVTSAGGTSLESDNPGTRPHPAYPAGVETVWNPDNLCNSSASEGGDSGFFWCSSPGVGAGGGGSSQFWGRPSYQRGRGVNNPFTTVGNGTTHCVLAAQGTPCREVPDISANADVWTPYAEFCTGSASTPESTCATFSGSPPAPGWFGVGGTSLSAPLWSAIIADRDSYQRHRSGNFNQVLYQLFRAHPNRYFHDITGIGPKQQAATSNGRFPTRPGYDEATGIGTPKMAALITSG